MPDEPLNLGGLFHNMPFTRYRLHDGRIGTEYEACLEVIKVWERRKQEAEDKIEEYRRRLETAEGNPG